MIPNPEFTSTPDYTRDAEHFRHTFIAFCGGLIAVATIWSLFVYIGAW